MTVADIGCRYIRVPNIAIDKHSTHKLSSHKGVTVCCCAKSRNFVAANSKTTDMHCHRHRQACDIVTYQLHVIYITCLISLHFIITFSMSHFASQQQPQQPQQQQPQHTATPSGFTSNGLPVSNLTNTTSTTPPTPMQQQMPSASPLPLPLDLNGQPIGGIDWFMWQFSDWQRAQTGAQKLPYADTNGALTAVARGASFAAAKLLIGAGKSQQHSVDSRCQCVSMQVFFHFSISNIY